jgi:citrate lyase subunit beta/citryl-CoA lyase
MRSKLFVPGARPDLFAKALASEADAISFDLEDSVPADGKTAARALLSEFLGSSVARATPKKLIVRVNALNTPFARDDLAAFTANQSVVINLPKVESAAEVVEAANLTGAPLLLNIESPRGLRLAAEIGGAHPLVIGLQAGLNDLVTPLGIDRRNRDHVRAALWQIRMGAGEAGCFAYDGAWPDIADDAGFKAEAELARSLGYLGKSCIHPAQLPVANEVFDDNGRLEEAERLVEAADAAAARGHGAFSFDGRMVDRPEIERAREVLRAAGRMSQQ